ncbi:hypothetical protein Pyn_34830 [Prunus yedoensis var. nudiflora]|uniref:Uncharacterized protein n=1 Tax=Prunus yedoensis var. nudiflora TaxID=2094558 RepID=A0A314Y704_PRUYE|nr:hypothetical protein Pyn_34830 [Prunus yedoensis var. nudiflora]
MTSVWPGLEKPKSLGSQKKVAPVWPGLDNLTPVWQGLEKPEDFGGQKKMAPVWPGLEKPKELGGKKRWHRFGQG